ncbi:MAG: hypothetical protein ACLRZ2_02485 [Veillonella sp.]
MTHNNIMIIIAFACIGTDDVSGSTNIANQTIGTILGGRQLGPWIVALVEASGERLDVWGTGLAYATVFPVYGLP